MLKSKAIFSFLFCFSSVLLTAQSVELPAPQPAGLPVAKPIDLRLLVGGALELGGDDIAEVFFTNGESQFVRTGQGGSLAVGGQLAFTRVPQFLLQATVGIKYVTTQADNAHIRLTRIPIHAMGSWLITKDVRLGAGVATHRNIRFKADGIGADIDFNSATGPRFEVAYRSVGLSYTLMDYTDTQNNRYAANSIGLFFLAPIPGRR